MSEELESRSLSKDTTDTNKDTGDDTEDTIKIPRVKLSHNGHYTVEIHKDAVENGLNLPLTEHGNEPELSAAVHQPFFEELTLEETAKMPVASSNGHTESAENDDVYSAAAGHENAVAYEPDVAHTTAIEEQDDNKDIGAPQSSLRQALPLQQQAQSRTIPYPLKPVAHLWNFSRVLCIALMLLPIVLFCFIGYVQLNHFQSNIYTVDAHTGTALWQHPSTGAEQTELVDEQGSVQVVRLANNEQLVVALDTHGAMLWQSFSSDGTFALPTIRATPGTVLATLSEQAASGHTLTLYSFNRATGHVNWQYEIAQPARTQGGDIVGADSNFIYALSVQAVANQQTQVQLLAINQYTGYIGWRANSPSEADNNPLDTGTLLLAGHVLAWQVDATIQVIDATQGNTLWTTSLPYSNISTLPQEEAQMVIVQGQLVVERNDALHSFDITTGKQRWNISVFDFTTGTIPASIAAAGQSILIYGNGQLGAIGVGMQKMIWQQRQMGTILGLHVSEDGRLIYVILLDSVEDSTPAQALVALNVQNGGAIWTFQPSDQFTFFHPQSDGFQYEHNVILATLCATATCNHPHLYALNAATGAPLWKFEGNGVANPLMSTDGGIVSYEGNTSAWQQFLQSLNG